MHARDQANIIVMDGRDTLEALHFDLEKPGTVHGWAYLMDYEFTARLFAPHLENQDISLIVDNKMRSVAADLQYEFARLRCWTWSYNRTMHDKTLLFPAQGLTWIGTHNLTQGSYWMALNRAVRIESSHLTRELNAQWEHDVRSAKPVVTTKDAPWLRTKKLQPRRKSSKT